MALYQSVERSFQRRNIESAVEAQDGLEVIRSIGRVELFQEPYPLLGERQRQRPLPIHWVQRLHTALPNGASRFYQRSQVGHCTAPKHIRERRPNTELFLDAPGQLGQG